MEKSTSVLLAEKHRLLREFMRTYLENVVHTATVVRETEELESVPLLAKKLRPHMVIVGTPSAEAPVPSVIHEVKTSSQDPSVVCLLRGLTPPDACKLIRAGADAVLPDHCSGEDMQEAFRTVTRGETWMPSSVLEETSESILMDESQVSRSPAKLTTREKDVARLLSEGYTTKEIAASLGVSSKTAHTHRNHLMTKLETNSVADVTRFAIRSGLSEL